MKKKSLKIWLRASRPKTLLLAIASVSMGLFLAIKVDGNLKGDIAIMTLITAILLQILSNLANDYGDFVHGADQSERQGPERSLQSGDISKVSMKRAIYLIVFLTAVSGTILILSAVTSENSIGVILFVILGAIAIWSAISYTAGKKPYGYAGFGDLAVFFFFGLVGVIGSYMLQKLSVLPSLLLPATSLGLFSVAVLNINNIRDIKVDKQAGKNTIPVRLGLDRARKYHWLLLLVGFLLSLVFVILDFSSIWELLFLLTFPLIIRNGWGVARATGAALNPYLGQMSLTTFIFVLLFGLGMILALNSS
jgi:1,4-dihydroxy-2-naphthoate octaprenyltransferase